MANDPRTITIAPHRPHGDCGWSPTQGAAFTDLLNANTALSDDEKERLVQETVSIMGKCVPPEARDTVNTGLVIGYVQSGKTLSFTSLAALARDNRFRLVILLAGTTNNLVEQSFDRLKGDLDIAGTREWKPVHHSAEGVPAK